MRPHPSGARKQLAGAAGLVYQLPMKKLLSIVLLFSLVGAGPAVAQGLLAKFERSNLTIIGATDRHEFDVELALTPDQRSQGLMYRREMAKDGGMLFDFGPDYGRASMWMKNTFIPLDMLFIKSDGRIESIAERTTPHSLEAISSRGPVRYVLELNGGTAARLGIGPGDRIELANKSSQ
jgi:uncharacterized membrane protein (UPF0127 family)